MATKRRRYDNQSGMAAGVDHLLRQQGRLKGNLPVSVGAGAGATGSGKASVPTYLVASSTTRSSMRRAADFTCDGTNDQEVIQAALDALPVGGGRVLLTEGTFNVVMGAVSSAIVVDADKTLEGVGPATYFNILSTGGAFWTRGIELLGTGRAQARNLMIGLGAVTHGKTIGLDVRTGASADWIWFEGMDGAALADMAYCGVSGTASVDNLYMIDLGTQTATSDNVGISMAGGSVANCYFTKGAGIVDAIGVSGYGKVVNSDFSEADIWLLGGGRARIANNDLYRSGLVLNGSFQTTIVGNTLEGYGGVPPRAGYDGIHFIASCAGVTISGNQFFDSDIWFEWDTFHNEISINVNNMQSSYGIGMVTDTVVGTETFRLEGFTVVGNEMSSDWGGGDIRIQLGHPDADQCSVINGIIGHNVVSSDTTQEAIILVCDQGSGSTSAEDSAVIIDGNILVSYSAVRAWGVVVYGKDQTLLWPGRTYQVTNNNLAGSDGIKVVGGAMAVVTGNIIPQSSAPVTPEGNALEVCGQIHVDVEEQALVRGNFVSVGKHVSTETTKAIIYVDAPKGTVSGNVVEGHVIAGANGIDTAIKLVTGAFNVFDNYYDGVGVRWAADETPLTNELVITGTGSKIGENGMTVDDSGTSTEFQTIDTERWSGPLVLVVKQGEHEIPFSGDVEIIEVEARLKTAPTGSAVIVDLFKNGVTMYTTPANRPEIAIATNGDTTVPDITTIADGDYLRMDIAQIDSNAVGQGLTVTVRYRRV